MVLIFVVALVAEGCGGDCPCVSPSFPQSEACLSSCNSSYAYPGCGQHCVDLCSDILCQVACIQEFCLLPVSSSLWSAFVGVLACMGLLATAKVAFTAKPVRLVPAYRQ